MSSSAWKPTKPEPEPEEEVVEIPKNLQIPDMWSMLARFILYRLNSGRDVKIITVARGGATGTGKTTLAVLIAQWVHSLLRCTRCSYYNDQNQLIGGLFPPNCDRCPYCGHNEATRGTPWNAEDGAYIDVWPYCAYYANEASEAEAIILDEAEAGADNRRSMSNENVKISQYWSALRWKNCVNIATLPSTLQVDKRLEQLGDVLINVQYRGVADIYWYWLNDREKQIFEIPVKSEIGLQERIFFESIEKNEEYLLMNEMKKVHFGEGGIKSTYTNEDVEEMREEMEDKLRVETTEKLLDKTNLNQGDIGEIVERGQQWVSRVNTGDFQFLDRDTKIRA